MYALHRRIIPADPTQMTFENKVIVITGASEGIGAELARQLARDRPKLVLAARGAEGLERVRRECRSRGAEAEGRRTRRWAG